MPETHLPLPTLRMRPARSTDIPALAILKGSDSQAVHRDRIEDAAQGDLQYLLLFRAKEIIGYACLVFRRPSHWSDAGDETRLPHIVDLTVAESRRGRGYGSRFMRLIEAAAAQEGYTQLFIQVDPRENPGAHRLYLRMGYQPLQSEPYFSTWSFVDSGGILHQGEIWALDMVKALPTNTPKLDPTNIQLVD